MSEYGLIDDYDLDHLIIEGNRLSHFTDDGYRETPVIERISHQWTRTRTGVNSFLMVLISNSGGSGETSRTNYTQGVRPACNLDFDKPVYLWSDGYYHLKEEPVKEEPVSLEQIELNHTTSTLTVGNTLKLTVTFTPDDAADKSITWSSSEESVAKVETALLLH